MALCLLPVVEAMKLRGKPSTSIYLTSSSLVPEPFLSVQTPVVHLRMWYRKRPSSQSTFTSVSCSFFFSISLFFFYNFFLLILVPVPLCVAVPLYQEYCLQEMKGYLQRMSRNPVSELLSPQYVQTLQSRICSISEAALPPAGPLEPVPAPSLCPSIPRSIPTVTAGTLWQDLEEVKASGITSNMTAKEIHLQEVS